MIGSHESNCNFSKKIRSWATFFDVAPSGSDAGSSSGEARVFVWKTSGLDLVVEGNWSFKSDDGDVICSLFLVPSLNFFLKKLHRNHTWVREDFSNRNIDSSRAKVLVSTKSDDSRLREWRKTMSSCDNKLGRNESSSTHSSASEARACTHSDLPRMRKWSSYLATDDSGDWACFEV